MRSRLLLMLMLTFFIQPSKSQAPTVPPISIVTGFMTGNDYREIPDSMKTLYIEGLFDAFMGSTQLGGDIQLVRLAKQCTDGMVSTQFVAIVDKYLNEHPEEWQYGMNGLAFKALFVTCPQFKQVSDSYFRARAGVKH